MGCLYKSITALWSWAVFQFPPDEVILQIQEELHSQNVCVFVTQTYKYFLIYSENDLSSMVHCLLYTYSKFYSLSLNVYDLKITCLKHLPQGQVRILEKLGLKPACFVLFFSEDLLISVVWVFLPWQMGCSLPGPYQYSCVTSLIWITLLHQALAHWNTAKVSIYGCEMPRNEVRIWLISVALIYWKLEGNPGLQFSKPSCQDNQHRVVSCAQTESIQFKKSLFLTCWELGNVLRWQKRPQMH